MPFLPDSIQKIINDHRESAHRISRDTERTSQKITHPTFAERIRNNLRQFCYGEAAPKFRPHQAAIKRIHQEWTT